MPSFTINYPSSVGTNWTFTAQVVGSQVVITGTAVSSNPLYYYYLGF